MTRILITGIARGIGHELAKAAVARGWDVLGSVRNAGGVTRMRDVFGDAVTPLVFDVTDNAAIARVAGSLEGGLDVLINNAGIIGPAESPRDLSDFEAFQKVLSVNTYAPLAVSRAFLPHLRRAEQARIISISSQMSWMGYAKSDFISYRASKAALNKIMQGMATDLAPEGIICALVDPGWVRTDMGGPEAEQNPTEVAAGILRLAEKLRPRDSGKFFKFNGQERPF